MNQRIRKAQLEIPGKSIEELSFYDPSVEQQEPFFQGILLDREEEKQVLEELHQLVLEQTRMEEIYQEYILELEERILLMKQGKQFKSMGCQTNSREIDQRIGMIEYDLASLLAHKLKKTPS